jgi:hypothetical protein
MSLFDQIFAAADERDDAAEVAHLAMLDFGPDAERYLNRELRRHRDSRSRRVVRLALAEVRRRQAQGVRSAGA